MRPFDSKRAGTVLSDGGALLLIESEHNYNQRGGKVPILAEITGIG
jgi:3-oxoacyl-(acyl-carrier-protein) synthase